MRSLRKIANQMHDSFIIFSLIIFSLLENIKLDSRTANSNPLYIIPAIIGLAIFIGLFYLLLKYIKNGKQTEINNPHELLNQFRAMEEEGELTAEELRNIKLMLAEKLMDNKKRT